MPDYRIPASAPEGTEIEPIPGTEDAVYCDGCENGAIKTVPVSCLAYGDDDRHFCAQCEEAYTAGVQHGVFMALCDPENEVVKVVKNALATLDRALARHGLSRA